MIFHEFEQMAKDRITAYLPPAYAQAEISLAKVEKLGSSYSGLVVRNAEEKAAPVINLERYFAMAENGEDPECILQKIAGEITDNELNMETGWLRKYGMVKQNLFLRLSNYERNKTVMDKVPCIRIEDLALTFHIRFSHQDASLCSVMITGSMQDDYGISKKELYADALQNSPCIFPAVLKNLSDVVCPPDWAEGLEENESGQIMVLTNREMTNGASALFYPDMMEKVSQVMGGDYYVLPSSIHELLLVPHGMTDDWKMLEKIVAEVNRNCVPPHEILSGHVYFYDAEKEQFRIMET